MEEEADESKYWLEMLLEAKLAHNHGLEDLLNEAHELTAIFTASGKTARRPSRRLSVVNTPPVSSKSAITNPQ